MSNECDLRPYQIQLSFLNPPPLLPISGRMFPSGLSWAAVHFIIPQVGTEIHFRAGQQCYQQPQRWSRGDTWSPGTQGCFPPWMGLRSHLALNGLLLTRGIHCARRKLTSRGGGRFHSAISLCVLYHLLPWNLIFSMCKKKALTRSAVSACMLQLANPVTRHKPAKCIFMMTCRLFPESHLASVNSAERSEDVRRIHICLTWAELVKRAELDEKPFFVLARSHFARMTVLHLTPFMDFKGSC